VLTAVEVPKAVSALATKGSATALTVARATPTLTPIF